MKNLPASLKFPHTISRNTAMKNKAFSSMCVITRLNKATTFSEVCGNMERKFVPSFKEDHKADLKEDALKKKLILSLSHAPVCVSKSGTRNIVDQLVASGKK